MFVFKFCKLTKYFYIYTTINETIPIRNLLFILTLILGSLVACTSSIKDKQTDSFRAYLDFSDRADQFEGGIRMIPIQTPSGEFNVWTKRVGNNPKMKVLLLHGGPGMTHELYSCFDGFFPAEGIEYIYYDQLGSAREASKKWTMPIRDWGTILNSFLLIFGDRVRLLNT